MSKSFQGTREIERFLIGSGFFWKISRQDSTKRNFAIREYRKRRKKSGSYFILSTFEISQLLRVKKDEHFFFFRKLRYSVFPQIYYYIHADNSTSNNRMEIGRQSSPRKTGIVDEISAEPHVYWMCSTFFLIFLWKLNPILVVEAFAPRVLVSCFFFFRRFARNECIHGNGFGSR